MSVQLLLSEADNLRLLTYRDLLSRLASPSPWAVPDKGAEVLENSHLIPTLLCAYLHVCPSFIPSPSLVRILVPKLCDSWQWMKLEIVILNEITQIQKNKQCMFSLVCESWFEYLELHV